MDTPRLSTGQFLYVNSGPAFCAFRASRPALAPPERERQRSEGERRGGGASGPAGRLDVHPRVAMQILRQSKIAVTMEIYTQIPSASTRDALKKLGQWLDT